MEPESFLPPSKDLVKCSNCGCSCSFVNGSSLTWIRSVKRKNIEFESSNKFVIPGFDNYSVARIQIENECVVLREMVGKQQKTIDNLCTELEEERSASSSATNEAMSMILRLQREKAEIQMEARQFKCLTDEKMAHGLEELSALEDLLYNREQAIQSLTCEVQAYKHRMMIYGLTEEEMESEKSEISSGNQMFVENLDSRFGFPPYDYQPLKCNLNESQHPMEDYNDVPDVDKYAFGDTPRHLKNLEYRIHQMERCVSSNQLDPDTPGGKSILEKVVVGQSPRKPIHLRRFSPDSSNSYMGMGKEMSPDLAYDSHMHNGSFKKMNYVLHTDDYYSNLRKLDNVSEFDDASSDRVYTIDSVHPEADYNVMKPKAGIEVCEDFNTTPRGSLYQCDAGDPYIKKLYMRLQALEADRESMRQAIVSLGTDEAQLVLLKEIAQKLCKERTPERQMPLMKTSFIRSFSFTSIFKWIVSFLLWRKKASRSKYMVGMSANMGLLLLLDRNPNVGLWRRLSGTQV